MASRNPLSRRQFLRIAGSAATAALLARCAPSTTEPAEPQVIRETIIVEGTPQTVEKVVEVERVVTAVPTQKKKVVVVCEPWFLAKLPSMYYLKEQYEAEFPDREVEYVRQEGDFTKAALEASQQTSSFDLDFGATPFVTLSRMVKADVIAPITELVPDAWRDLVPQALIDEATYEGELYAWPFEQIGTCLNYRKSYLAEAGHEAEPGQTLDEYLAVCEDVQATVKASDGSMVWGNVFDMVWWRAPTAVGINMMGTDWYGADGTLAWDDPRTAEVFRVMKQLADFGPPETKSGTGGHQIFEAGKAALFLAQSENAIYEATNSFGLADLAVNYPPIFPGGQNNPRTVIGGVGSYFYKYGHIEEAWHFFNWLWPKEEFHTGVTNEAKWIPVHLDYLEADWTPGLIRELVSIIKHGVSIPVTDHYLDFVWPAMEGLSQYLLGNIETPEEAIATIKTNFEDALEKQG